MRNFLAITIAFLLSGSAAMVSIPCIAQTTDTESDFRWNVLRDRAELFDGDGEALAYVFQSGNRPIVYPVVGPGGLAMTRDYPMKPVSGKGTRDHVHHRSIWMTHGIVNGVDFWAEEAVEPDQRFGRVVHDKVVSHTVSDGTATLGTTANWITPDDEVVLLEKRKMIVAGDREHREIEFIFDLFADKDAVVFGDTKEGTFGIRVPDSMMVDAQLGGLIVNEHGQTNSDAWGQRASWVDYSGPVDGRTMGITVLEHPTSYGHPCRWHVRTYGLFAANPFGEVDFTQQKATKVHRLMPGKSLRLRYKILLHAGGADNESINRKWAAFAESE